MLEGFTVSLPVHLKSHNYGVSQSADNSLRIPAAETLKPSPPLTFKLWEEKMVLVNAGDHFQTP